jgi:uncharacterized DUF497 family protein
MKVTFDPAKRETALANRGLDFADARKFFEGDYAEIEDDRRDYGEQRYIAAGYLAGRMVVMACAPRGDAADYFNECRT